jgi:UPF0755 protein
LIRLIVIVVLAAAALIAWNLNRPSSLVDPVVIDIPRGTSTAALAEMLAADGVVERPIYLMAARALRYGKRLQAGEYRFDEPESPLQIVDRMIRGDVLLHTLVVPEGSNIFDLARIVNDSGFAEAEQVMRLTRGQEGFLFPETYAFTKGTTPERIVRTMRERFDKVWAGLQPGAVDKNQVVTIASLVEKETSIEEERPIVASVYWNRVRKGMRMDCDPTVIYAALLEGKYRGTIYQSDLERDSPYNTYRVTGLPPGPIANPGEASLRAALRPANTDYLFFVALPDGSGRHAFSRTIGEHNRAVLEYRRGQAGAASGASRSPASGSD